MAYDGMGEACCEPYNSKFQHSQAKTPANPDRINSGRGPTRAGTTGDNTGVSTANTGKINGGTKIPACSMDINVGRGPTRVGSK